MNNKLIREYESYQISFQENLRLFYWVYSMRTFLSQNILVCLVPGVKVMD